MTKVKYLVLTTLIIAILLIPNISKAETLTYKDTAQNIEWSYELDSTGNNVINLKCNTKTASGTVNIPSSIDGKPVTSLKKGSYKNAAFSECVSINEIIIPDTITQIADYAFEKLTGLKTITIPNTVTLIGESALEGCSGLTSITLPNNLIEIGSSAFRDCSGLKNITIPNTVVKIGSYAFSKCPGLKSIVVPNSVTTIGNGAFSGCSGLTSVTLSNKMSVIDEWLFEDCTSLKSIIIPDSVTTIEGDDGYGTYAPFRNCTNLEKILIPDSVSTIKGKAFYGCKKLTIYGNDGMKSKEYAEENGITFDYIANWDKVDSGSDITSPTVKSIEVPYTSVLNYYDSNSKMYVVPTGKIVTINVNFSEEIEGTTSPTLTIKFGSGQNIELTNGIIQGKKITYTYTIKSTDKGIMTAVELKGGNIKDVAGNTATLSCPTLEIELGSSNNLYANGTTTNPNDTNVDKDSNNGNTNSGDSNNGNTNNGDSNNGNSNNGNINNGGSNNGNSNNGNTNNGGSNNNKDKGASNSGSSNNGGATNKGDNTQMGGRLPNTGVNQIVVIIAVLTVAIGTIMLVKYRKMKDIK